MAEASLQILEDACFAALPAERHPLVMCWTAHHFLRLLPGVPPRVLQYLRVFA